MVPELQAEYRERMRQATEWILEQLAAWQISATFFIVGQIAETNAELVRAIHEAGHEVASHGWDHRRIHVMTPQEFREDLRTSKDALEQASGAARRRLPGADVQHRAARPPGPWTCSRSWSFSTTRRSTRSTTIVTEYRTHPADPFLAQGRRPRDPGASSGDHPDRWRESPVGGGGYFRLLPLPS